jgi:hypothetical protein
MTMLVQQQKTVVHMLVRDHANYFYNKWENGRQTVQAQPITAQRAEAIWEAHQTAVQTGRVSFAPGAPAWSWTSEAIIHVTD